MNYKVPFSFPWQSYRRHKVVQVTLVIVSLVILSSLLVQSELSSRLATEHWHTNNDSDGTSLTNLGTPNLLTKPDNITVSGLVFYGRKSRASILRCYLERNMVDHGGWLDEILWIVNTNKENDLRYLDEIIATNPARHKKVIPEETLSTPNYWKAWRHLERGKHYVKIDDDILWIDDNAIANLVTRKMQNPNDFVVSGNVINNPPLGFFHYRMGALHPYFPETVQPTYTTNTSWYWKSSMHGYWDGPGTFTWDAGNDPPFNHHRWLRVQDERMMAQTPAHRLKYEVWGTSYEDWSIAAQQHYSLLENIETNQLDLYKFDKPWIMHEDRIRINFMCVYADDILDTDIDSWTPGQGDEDMIVLNLPKQLRRPVVIQGNALASHFQYMDQWRLRRTDLLKRYRSLAKDRYCLPSTPIDSQ